MGFASILLNYPTTKHTSNNQWDMDHLDGKRWLWLLTSTGIFSSFAFQYIPCQLQGDTAPNVHATRTCRASLGKSGDCKCCPRVFLLHSLAALRGLRRFLCVYFFTDLYPGARSKHRTARSGEHWPSPDTEQVMYTVLPPQFYKSSCELPYSVPGKAVNENKPLQTQVCWTTL